MTTKKAPGVDNTQVFPTLLVDDIPAAVSFYTSQLGFTHRFSWGSPPTFAGVDLGKTTIHLGKAAPGPKGYAELNFVVDDADLLFAFHKANGVEVVSPPEDQPFGLRTYQVKDPYNNYLGFGHYIYNQGPPVKIERISLPVRLEKRLAAVLEELATHNRSSLSGCLEEILLHCFERVGDSSASPFTVSTLEYIQELKAKHGINYDTHDAYRFIE
ncbi:VOC family protein [Chitinophaga sp. 212800010-3]|uniref:VOC family protein n=1 Tax=unclassified Chitinophaga TaxID=2619133 RepID=UPI002DF6A052|nr:VOC domain-containing protein [Chitinophaga sp. 212800010-3]